MSVGAGWQPDPEQPGQMRWWDGSQWTDHRSPTPAPSAASPTNRNRLFVIGGAVVLAVLLLVVINPFGGSNGSAGFCADYLKANANKNLSEKEEATVFNRLVDEAPAEIRADIQTLADALNGHLAGSATIDTSEVSAAGTRADDFAAAHCQNTGSP